MLLCLAQLELKLRWYCPDVAWRLHHQGQIQRAVFYSLLTYLYRASSLETSPPLTRKTRNSNLSCSMTSSKRVSLVIRLSLRHLTVFVILAVHKAQPGWRRIIAQAVLWGIPTPAFSTALSFFDGYRSEIVPANLIQGQVY